MQNRIRELRESKELSINQLAGRLDTTANVIKNWEAQKYQPNHKYFLLLTTVLESTLEEIFIL